MNLGKAKDYFSSYYEGSLDRGLRQSFENRLGEDAQLQAEYRAFERTMKDLESYGLVEIEPPADLHEKIAARLDKAIWDQKQAKPSILSLNWFKGAVMTAAVAAGVFVIAFFGLNHNSVASSNNANLLGIGSASDQFTFSAKDGNVRLSMPVVNHKSITIRNSKGEVKDSFELNNQGINDKLFSNNLDTADYLTISVDNQDLSPTYVALPGKKLDTTTSGKGNLKDLAVAIAGHFGKPVVVLPLDTADKTVSWDFNSSDAISVADSAVKPLGLAVQEDTSGVIEFHKN